MNLKKQRLIPLTIGIVFFLLLLAIEVISILRLNNGLLTYTLDDPYIHLALAENIRNGHYGINTGEFSAPSSSIIWPFLLSVAPDFEWFPFILNLIFSLLTVYVIFRIIEISISIKDNLRRLVISSLLLLLLSIVASNLIGLMLTGMEHSLQVLSVATIALGLIYVTKDEVVKTWLLIFIVLAPLIRYENIAISVPAIGLIIAQKQYKKAIWVSIALIILFSAHIIFMKHIGQGIFPTSIIMKSNLIGGPNKLYALWSNFKTNFSHRTGIILSLLALFFLSYVFFIGDAKRKKLLASATILSISIHLLGGQYDWYKRYEIYIWSFSILIGIYLVSPYIVALATSRVKLNLLKLVIIITGFFVIINKEYITILPTIPTASNNIYEQHYQMHRFATEYYQDKIAANDIGYVSYKNENYVLDLWGLASKDILKTRRAEGRNNHWMDSLIKSKGIGLAMIYDEWFGSIPENWVKIGELHLGKKRITPAISYVSFYATSEQAYPKIMRQIEGFRETLPNGAKFIMSEN